MLLCLWIGCTGKVKTSESFQGWHLLVGEGGGPLLFRKEALPRSSAMTHTVPGKANIPSAVVPVDRLHGDSEEEQGLSGLAASLWEKGPDVCLFGMRLG